MSSVVLVLVRANTAEFTSPCGAIESRDTRIRILVSIYLVLKVASGSCKRDAAMEPNRKARNNPRRALHTLDSYKRGVYGNVADAATGSYMK
jgi:hypothetical protein